MAPTETPVINQGIYTPITDNPVPLAVTVPEETVEVDTSVVEDAVRETTTIEDEETAKMGAALNGNLHGIIVASGTLATGFTALLKVLPGIFRRDEDEEES